MAAHRTGRTASAYSLHQAQHLGDIGAAISWLDRIGCRFGIDVRHPFLDRELVEFMLAIAPQVSYRSGRGKLLLRRAMAGRLPESICWRWDKTNFQPYLEQALLGGERELEGVVRRSALERMGIVEGDRVLASIRAFGNAPGNSDGMLVFRLLECEFWLAGQWQA